MKLMIPFTPHLSYECLEMNNCKSITEWPKVDKNVGEEIKLAVQINGKTRDIVSIKKDLNEKQVISLVSKSSKISKYLSDGKIVKTIFVKNKIINYILVE